MSNHNAARTAGLNRLSNLLGSAVIDAPRARARQADGTATNSDLHNGTRHVACIHCGAEPLYPCTTDSGRRAGRPHATRLHAAGITR